MGTLLVFACAGCSKKEADKENEAVAVVNNMQHASASTDGALLFKDGVVYYSDVEKGVSTGSLTLCLPLDFHNPLQHSPLRLIFLSNFKIFLVIVCHCVV